MCSSDLIRDQLQNAGTSGFPLHALRVVLCSGEWQGTDSPSVVLRIAAAAALREALSRASRYLLEPVMRADVFTPEAFVGSVVGEISRRRGTIRALGYTSEGKTITADVPLSGMFGYATSLRSATQGQGTFSMEFSCYSEVPRSIAPLLPGARSADGERDATP